MSLKCDNLPPKVGSSLFGNAGTLKVPVGAIPLPCDNDNDDEDDNVDAIPLKRALVSMRMTRRRRKILQSRHSCQLVHRGKPPTIPLDLNNHRMVKEKHEEHEEEE